MTTTIGAKTMNDFDPNKPVAELCADGLTKVRNFRLRKDVTEGTGGLKTFPYCAEIKSKEEWCLVTFTAGGKQCADGTGYQLVNDPEPATDTETKAIDWTKPVRWKEDRIQCETLCLFEANGARHALLKWRDNGADCFCNVSCVSDAIENVPPDPPSLVVKMALATHPEYGVGWAEFFSGMIFINTGIPFTPCYGTTEAEQIAEAKKAGWTVGPVQEIEVKGEA